MDKDRFGQVLLLSTLPTYPKSLNIFLLKFVLKRTFCQTSDLGLRLEVDFVFPLSQEQQEEEEEQPLTKIYRTDTYFRSGIWHIDLWSFQRLNN